MRDHVPGTSRGPSLQLAAASHLPRLAQYRLSTKSVCHEPRKRYDVPRDSDLRTSSEVRHEDPLPHSAACRYGAVAARAPCGVQRAAEQPGLPRRRPGEPGVGGAGPSCRPVAGRGRTAGLSGGAAAGPLGAGFLRRREAFEQPGQPRHPARQDAGPRRHRRAGHPPAHLDDLPGAGAELAGPRGQRESFVRGQSLMPFDGTLEDENGHGT